jgi:hypothetical protein
LDKFFNPNLNKQMDNKIEVVPQQKDNHVIYICNATKQPYFNLAQARIIFPNVPLTTLKRRLEDVPNSLVKTAVIRANNRDYDVPLYPAEVLLDLAFEFDLPLAKLMGKAGATVYLYGVAGYQIQIDEPKPPVRVLPEKLDVAMGIKSLNESTLPASVKQLLIDSLVNEYIDNTPKLATSVERWVGLVQKAEELGFKTNNSNRVKLGHYGSQNSERLVRQREDRLCNGEMRAIWVYLDDKNLELVIREYFAIEAVNAKH